METLIHADIFFFVTTIAVLMVTAVFVVVMIYAVRILRDVQHIIRRIREESDFIMEDIEELRTRLKRAGEKTTHIGQLLGMILSKISPGRKSSRRRGARR